MHTLRVRQAKDSDQNAIAEMCALLWPDAEVAEHRRQVSDMLTTRMSGTLPAEIFVAHDSDGSLAGFIEMALRSHADGCDTAHPVGFIEGWFVHEPFRHLGVGRKLVQAAEEWARARGCTEMASDTWVDDERSERAHRALGFEVVDRCIHFRKVL